MSPMTHADLRINLFFLFLLAGCASYSNISQIDSDYQILLAEQRRAHHKAGFNTPFRKVIDDYRNFKKQLFLTIKEKYASRFHPDELRQIESILAGVTPERKHKPALGVDVFQRFQGQWRGEWIQNRQKTVYDHTWFAPYEIRGGLIAKKVIIRRWDDRRQKPIDEIAAINTYNPKNNLILGAVDVHRSERKSTYAPHLGFCIDPNTFIWIGCIAANSGNPSYSFYFEKVSTIDRVNHYKIKCLGFNWNRKSKKIVNPNWREGHYVQVGSVPSSAAGG